MEDKIHNSSDQKDLRVKKTYRALYDALITVLNYRNFGAITVNDLCSEAFISRATFYAHFNDKYDLLRRWLVIVRKSIIKDVNKYEELKAEINQFVYSNQKIITNILKDANSETLALIREFISHIVELTIKRKINDESSPQHIILLNFCIGGLVNLLTWIVENKYPPEISMMNNYLYKMLEALTVWDAEHEKGETPSWKLE